MYTVYNQVQFSVIEYCLNVHDNGCLMLDDGVFDGLVCELHAERSEWDCVHYCLWQIIIILILL